MKLQTPSDFKSYKKWQKQDGKTAYRGKIQRVQNELQEVQKEYAQLEKQKSNLYRGSVDYDKTKGVKDAFEKAEKQVEKLQKKIAKLEDEASKAERKKAELWQEFIEDVAESEYLEALADQFQKKFDELHEMNNVLNKWDSDQFSDLRPVAVAELYNWQNGTQDGRKQALKKRMEAIRNNEYKHRALIQLEKSNQ